MRCFATFSGVSTSRLQAFVAANMKQPDNQARHDHSQQEQTKTKENLAQTAEQATPDPGAERGERMETGKTIARGGKSTGKVPGASEQKSQG